MHGIHPQPETVSAPRQAQQKAQQCPGALHETVRLGFLDRLARIMLESCNHTKFSSSRKLFSPDRLNLSLMFFLTLIWSFSDKKIQTNCAQRQVNMIKGG